MMFPHHGEWFRSVWSNLEVPLMVILFLQRWLWDSHPGEKKGPTIVFLFIICKMKNKTASENPYGQRRPSLRHWALRKHTKRTKDASGESQEASNASQGASELPTDWKRTFWDCIFFKRFFLTNGHFFLVGEARSPRWPGNHMQAA